jgi:hypothetical protein
MKKIILIIIAILIVGGVIILCNIPNNKENNNTNNKIIKEEEKEDIKEEPKYVDNNPIILGLYKNYRNGSPRKLIKEYTAKWVYHKDISSFEVYYTNEEEITNNNQIKTFDLYKDKYENIDNYKIGYIINFNINDEVINKTIISPKDVEEFYDYLEIYLYDDYHRSGGWYSHTTESEFNNNTLLTSIKLTAGKKINEITSDITLTAFTYDEDDFDESNNYLGISKYTLIVKKDV